MAIDQVASLPFLSPLTLSLFSFPSGKSSFAATVLGHCSLMGTWTSMLSAFSLQHCNPRMRVHPSLLGPQLPPHPQLREIWFISLYLVLVHLELVPSPLATMLSIPFLFKCLT